MHLQGVQTAVISAWLGHSSPAFTMCVYVHSQEVEMTSLANTLAGLFDSPTDIGVTARLGL